MNYLVIGAGNAGRPVARLLNNQNHKVIITDPKQLSDFKQDNMLESTRLLKKIRMLESEVQKLKDEKHSLKKQFSESTSKSIYNEVKKTVSLAKKDAFDSIAKSVKFTNESEYRKDLEKVVKTISASAVKEREPLKESVGTNSYAKFL